MEKLLLDPLTFLLKKEIREEAMQAGSRAHRPLMTDLCVKFVLDNRDKAMFAYDEQPKEAGLAVPKARKAFPRRKDQSKR